MQFFLDTADTAQIRKWKGLIAGVTTNPALLSQCHNKEKVLREICEAVEGPVSIEVNATLCDEMIKEADHYREFGDNVCIKLPSTPDGFLACARLSEQGIQTNVTLCFSVFQALAAAHAGATFVSPFVGRLEDHGEDGLGTLQDIVEALQDYPNTYVLAASLRHPYHVKEAALMGCPFATIPPAVFEKLLFHPLTEKGLIDFQRCASL